MSPTDNFIGHDREEIFIKSEQAIHMLFILCANVSEKNTLFIENEIRDIVASLLRVGYERKEIVTAFNNWQDAYEKDNPCIDEHLNRIFNPQFASKTKDPNLYNNLVDQWVEDDKNDRNLN